MITGLTIRLVNSFTGKGHGLIELGERHEHFIR